MQQYVVIFDSLQQKIGFIGNYQTLNMFYSSKVMLNMLDAVFYASIVLAIALVLSKKKKNIVINRPRNRDR